ncbi:MAG: 30S ribosomal protein S6 [Patescibacteria group bacterium]
MQIYEVGYLILPSIPEEGLPAVVEKMKAVVTKAGGQNLDGEDPVKQDLAYTMSKTVGASKYVANEAYMGWMKCELEPAVAPEVKAELDKVEELLRFLIVKAPRESSFTFAKAREALLEKAREEKALAEAPEEIAPVEAVVE